MMSIISRNILYILILLFSFHGISQNKIFTGDPDRAFEVARDMAFNEQRSQAQDSLLLILTKYPDYHDIREFLGTTYSWDGAYKKAREEFSYILNKDTNRKNTWVLAIKNEIWAEKPYDALNLVSNAIKYFPRNAEILYQKASAQESSEQPETALQTLESILEDYPNDEKAQSYQKSLKLKLSYNTIGINAAVDIYSEVFDPMQYYSIKYKRQTSIGSIIARVNFNRRFEENGVQFEVDMYPKIAKGLYAYLNVGVANTFLFPDVRYGGELHQSLPKSFEISLGFRALKFSSTTTIYTGSISWYTGNSYWSFRPYITPGDTGSSESGTLNYRKYRSDANNYLSIETGMGFSPDINRFDFEGNEDAIIDLKSQKLNIGYYFSSPNGQNLWGQKIGVTHQEISFDPGNYFWIYSFSLTWELKFK